MHKQNPNYSRKPSRYWTLSFAPQPQCISESTALLAAGIVNTVLDLAVVIIPIPTIRRLQLPYGQQILLILLFGAGFAITLAGAVRTYYIWKVTTVWDKTWEIYPAWISSSVELYVGIVWHPKIMRNRANDNRSAHRYLLQASSLVS
jgi:hypothetical protein